jgi:hypothetical protein
MINALQMKGYHSYVDDIPKSKRYRSSTEVHRDLFRGHQDLDNPAISIFRYRNISSSIIKEFRLFFQYSYWTGDCASLLIFSSSRIVVKVVGELCT